MPIPFQKKGKIRNERKGGKEMERREKRNKAQEKKGQQKQKEGDMTENKEKMKKIGKVI